MKARVKATGEIVEVYFYGKEGYDYVCNDKEECYERGELEILDEPDYWTRLEHQAAIAAMQGMLNNSYLAGEFRKDPNNGIEDMSKIITKAAAVYAHALVEKYKKEEK